MLSIPDRSGGRAGEPIHSVAGRHANALQWLVNVTHVRILAHGNTDNHGPPG
jgi:hypothetical protein